MKPDIQSPNYGSQFAQFAATAAGRYALERAVRHFSLPKFTPVKDRDFSQPWMNKNPIYRGPRTPVRQRDRMAPRVVAPTRTRYRLPHRQLFAVPRYVPFYSWHGYRVRRHRRRGFHLRRFL